VSSFASLDLLLCSYWLILSLSPSPPPLLLPATPLSRTGTRSAFNSKFYDADLTMWSSFRVSDSQLTDAWKLVIANPFSSATINYLTLWFQSVRADLGKPDVLTRWYAAGIFLLQFICILVSCNVTNKDDTTLIFVTILVCGLNIFLVSPLSPPPIPVLLLTLLFPSPPLPSSLFLAGDGHRYASVPSAWANLWTPCET
jgi:hypothetical protein